MKIVTFLTITLLVGSLYGCASIVSRSEYPVTIISEPDDTKITIVNKSGQTVFSGRTPITVQLKAGNSYFQGNDYIITFEKEGYAKSTARIKRSIAPWYIVGNIAVAGLIGWLIVDPMTGAMWTLEDHVHINLQSLPSPTSLKNEDGLHIISLDDVPTELRPYLVKIN